VTTAVSEIASDRDSHKRLAAERAVQYITSGMVVGLGAGTTAAYATRLIGAMLADGRLRDVRGVPCSSTVAALARACGVPLTGLGDDSAVGPADDPTIDPTIDLTIDGADEVDPHLNLIKGGGGALVHEKIVAQASRREVIVVDEEKPSPVLGTRWPVPVEVLAFGWRSQARYLESLGARVVLRLQGATALDAAAAGPGAAPYRTDEGNLILDCHFGPIGGPAELAALAARIDARAGVVGHGLFLGLASEVIVAGPGGLRHLNPAP
jgi:ribose 5-phosphate isomerase A